MLGIGHIGIILIVISVTMFSIIPNSSAYLNAVVMIPSGTGVPGCAETDRCFAPSIATIDAGGFVTWTNIDSEAHTVTSGTPSDSDSVGAMFDSGVLLSQARFSYTFEEEGIVDYFCILHPWQQGMVIVGESGFMTSDPVPYTPPPSGTDWESKYFEAVAKFNDASAKVGELNQENDMLKTKISELEKTIQNLNALVMEQLNVIYEWVVNR